MHRNRTGSRVSSLSFTYKKHLEEKNEGDVFLLPHMSHNPDTAFKLWHTRRMCVLPDLGN